jgi:hypothetical protein
MSEDIRKMIDKVKNFKQFVNENVNDLTTLYHGSKFLFNKFDMSRVNTGQHSQDFGYGLYFTSNKDTAKFYANELSNTKTPIEKYNDIIKNNEKNEILYQYLSENRIISAKRILNDLIVKNNGDINEWKELLKALDTVQRYGYLYTVNINGGNFITKDEYVVMKHKLNIADKEMNNVLLKQGYNGIKYKITSFGLDKSRSFEKEYNVVIIDDKIIHITNTEKVEFEGILKLNYI